MDEKLIERDKRRLRNHFNIDKKRRTEQHKQMAPHFHNYFELYYMWEGECRFFLHDTIYNLEKGDFLLIAPNDYHSSTYDNKGFHDRCAIYFDRNKLDDRVYGYLKDQLSTSHQFSIYPQKSVELHEYLYRMLKYYDENSEVGDMFIDYMFPEFLLFLSQNCDFSPDRKKVTETEHSLEKAARFIAANYQDDITLEDAAEVAGFTASYFSRKFKELTEVGFREYLLHIRLTHAAKMIRDTNCSVLEVSQKCGFSSSNYFGDAFRAAFGKSPRDYRKSEEESSIKAM